MLEELEQRSRATGIGLVKTGGKFYVSGMSAKSRASKQASLGLHAESTSAIGCRSGQSTVLLNPGKKRIAPDHQAARSTGHWRRPQ
jgi:hypothetical protein